MPKRSGIRLVFARNVVTGTMIGRGAHNGQGRCKVHAVFESQGFEGREHLVVVHAQHRVELAEKGRAEETVGTIRTVHLNACRYRLFYGGLDDGFFFVAQQAIVAGMWVQREHGNARLAHPKIELQGAVHVLDFAQNVFGMQLLGHFFQRNVTRNHPHPQFVAH